MTAASATREAVAKSSRVVIKAGSSSLTTADGHIDNERVDLLVNVVAELMTAGREVVLVSSGAIAAGIGPLGLPSRPTDVPTQQAAASVGQGRLLERYTATFGRCGLTVGQVLVTADDIGRRVRHRNAQSTLLRLIELGVVAIVNENDTVATEEIRYGDNDRLAALVAHLVHASALVLLSDVDALYDGPPSISGAKKIREVSGPQDLAEVKLGSAGSHVGSGGMRTKVESARIANAAGIPVVLTSLDHARDALAGADVGTVFHPTGKRRSTRLLWLEFASDTCGRLTLDAGAAEAVLSGKASLLPAGITHVDGEFSAGDPVDIVDVDGRSIARGLVNFDSAELPPMLGRSTKELAAELGSQYEREIVHRDDLVLLDES